ncbi:MAG: UDP-glucose dehydrogenase family protein [Alphaproteobacteria bacterium]
MKIVIIGTGYVGLPTGVGLAELGHDVTCIDTDRSKINALNAGKITLFEEGLEALLIKNIKAGRIRFTTSKQEVVPEADVVLIAVGTPPHPVTKEADMKYIHAAAKELAPFLTGYTVVATKSTVPVGTGEVVENIIRTENPDADFDVISLPEFLREGFAVHDFFNPDRIIIGTDSPRARDMMRRMYQSFADKTHILYVSRRSSETIKYASNAFLAMKIHYINEMADFCEKNNADIAEVALGMGTDSRIGNRFLNPGPGFGGSCFPKDTMAMAYMGQTSGVHLSLIEKTIEKNAARKEQIANRVLAVIRGIKKPRVGILGLAFKEGTDDCRESPAMDVITALLKKKHNTLARWLHTQPKLSVYDPQAEENAKKILGRKVKYAADMYEALEQADIMLVLTEWPQFRDLDLKRAKSVMRGSKIIDLRNVIPFEAALANGFEYKGIGRPLMKPNR